MSRLDKKLDPKVLESISKCLVWENELDEDSKFGLLNQHKQANIFY
jgi:hypothetical protein